MDADPYAGTNLYVRDLSAGTTTLVTRSITGALSTIGPGGGIEHARRPVLSTAVFSPDGKSLAFGSTATDLTN